jgi:deazaflavin-dependent oxidoreductase (nitroreductase family)
MPFPRALARFNRRVTNRITGGIAGRLPGVDLIEHAGRRSGRLRRTPVSAFRQPAGFAIALNYGTGSDWVRNVLAANGCTLETKGERHRLTHPRVVRDPARRLAPRALRPFLWLIGVDAFLVLDQ